jgi:Plavaka transposase
MTGNRQAHPLLISLVNLDMDYRNKSSNRAFFLLALLPIPTFTLKDKKITGVLKNRVFHECLDFVLEPLKQVASIRVMINDPLGYHQYCFTLLASCIVDTPESALYACVGGKTSSVTMAYYKTFGNSERQEPRTVSTTIAQLQSIESNVHPWDLQGYIKAAKEFCLNGIHRPFWRDWIATEPSLFLTPESLHHHHKMFWDHDAKWCIHTVGAEEIDFRFSVLQPHTSF